MELFDSLGRLIIQQDVSNQLETTINVQQLHTGTYFLKVKTQQKTFLKKVIK
ncbi:T9SS type A sorting domain-containing protein [Kordia sp.]|uniref:T9SS type A sorting domain-containing protein n=1 Tax=Kordia sp. TaxID=1965332 RepID=UPI003B5A65D4